MFSRFDTMHASTLVTDRRTDGIGVAYTELSIASRGNNKKVNAILQYYDSLQNDNV